MNEPVVFTRGFSVALVALLQAVMPPLIPVGTLLLLCKLYGVEIEDFFQVLAVVVAILSSALPRGMNANGTVPLLPATIPLTLSVVARWSLIVAVLLGLGYVTKHSDDFSRRVVLTWVVVTPCILVLSALCLNELMRRLLNEARTRRVAFAGCTEASIALAERITANSETLGLSVNGFFDDRSAGRLGIGTTVNLLGTLQDLVGYVKRSRVDVIFIALPIRHVQRVMTLVDELRDTTASIYYVPDIFVFDLIQARTGEVLGMPVVAICETPFYGYRGIVKRMTDICFALLIILFTAPLMLAIAIGVRWSSPGPVFFKQRRYGLDGREITIYKFRTMTVLEDGQRVVQARRDDARVTRLGKFLRRYSLDELPQLINVLQGRMSLVGPRPHAVAHNEEYRRRIQGYMVRHKAPPGITGLAQINGCRGETARVEDMQARVDYDLEYLRRWTPLLDLKILLVTAIRVFRDSKAY
jgi:putative colanic acid biosynthesis UDP-glucose lipid carrier transferase